MIILKGFVLSKVYILIFSILISSTAFAKIDFAGLSNELYPESTNDQNFVSKFFEIVEKHKSSDPLLEGQGPSIESYSLDKIKFAFMINETSTTVDLAIFNWTLPLADGFSKNQKLSSTYGSPVYVIKAIAKEKIATQGENHDLLSNFSYLMGAEYFKAQMTAGSPGVEIPEELVNWKPHSEYMDRNHPLRFTLDTEVLVLLSPKKELFLTQAGATEETRPFFETMFQESGGYFNMIMGMMVHEMYHVKEGEDNANNRALKRHIPEDRASLIEQLGQDEKLKKLYSTYAKVVFSIGDQLVNDNVSFEETEKLEELKKVINTLKSEYPNAWAFIWGYEYTEGFAEYVSAFSMVQVQITTLSEQIELQKKDNNNFAYRTGTFGGLYLAYRIKEMPFSSKEDHRESVWEIILRKLNTQESTLSTTEIMTKYESYPFDVEIEIGSVIEYLTSTVMDLQN